MSYYAVHEKLKKERGRAVEHPCSRCGATDGRREWAYLYNAGSAELREPSRTGKEQVYTEDIWACYAPMCIACHRSFDKANDPAIAEYQVRHGRELAAQYASRPKGPEWTAAIWEARRERLATDPAFAEEQRSIRSASVRGVNLKRYRCDDCGYENNAGNMGWHRKKTGHENRSEVMPYVQ